MIVTDNGTILESQVNLDAGQQGRLAFHCAGKAIQNGFCESFNGRMSGELGTRIGSSTLPTPGQSWRIGSRTTILHHNTHLSMPLKERGFAGRGLDPVGYRALRCARSARALAASPLKRGSSEDPRAVRERVTSFDLSSLRRQLR